MTDAIADSVQPEGQGGEGGGAPYQEYLDRIPEEVRGQVEPVFKDWDANTTRRFQEHADFRKTWEPYQNTGISNVDPERVQWAMQFLEAHDNNPGAIRDWYQAYAQSNNLIDERPPVPEPEFDQFGFEDQSKQFEKLLDQRLSQVTEKLGAFEQFQQSLMQGAREAQEREKIDAQLAEIRSKHPNEFTPESEQFLEKLIGNYVSQGDPQSVQKGWQDFQAFRNWAEKQALQASANATGGGGELGGPADANPPEIKTLKDANPVALEMVRSMFRNQ